ncbi:MAG TPA: amidohydrolase family protein [Luteolibacter sp.]|nr:amidohydrolase family protein [Luteolibacter sp.]
MKSLTALLLLNSVLWLSASAQTVPEKREQFHSYLLIGGKHMAEPVAAAAPTTTIERCFLLTDKGWEPALSGPDNAIGTAGGSFWNGPAKAFAKDLLAGDPQVSVGLIIATQPEVNSENWGVKSEAFRKARKLAKIAQKQSTIQGILWHGGEVLDPWQTEIDHLKTLIAYLRTDLRGLNLPVVIGTDPASASLKAQLAALVQDVHATALASPDPKRADASPYAAPMRTLIQQWPLTHPKPTIPIIDAHIHAMAGKPGGLEPVIAWMERNGIERALTSPINDAHGKTEDERRVMFENFAKYRGRIERFCLIEPGEVATVEEAVRILEKEKAAGAVAFGEHYGVGLMFDDPKNLLLYEACGKVGLPVMFHIDASKNMDEKGLKRVERVLTLHPSCKLIAHARWWHHLPDGTCARLMEKYPNLYADISGPDMVSILNRDRGQTRDLMTRFSDRILFGSDAGWWSFNTQAEDRELHFELLEHFGLPEEIKKKIYRDNAIKLFGLKP